MSLNSNARVLLATTVGALILIFGFQNCAPALPLDGVADVSSNPRATATPGTSATPNPTGTIYQAVDIDGVCSDNPTNQTMAVAKAGDISGGNLLAFTRPDGYAAIWKVKGNAIYHGQVCYMISSGWSLAAVGDFDGDYNTDVMWRNTNNQVAVWLMNGANRVRTGIIGNIAPEWQVEGVGNMDTDGRNDVLWRNVATGAIKRWAMAGLSAPTEVPLQNAGADMPLSYKLQGIGDFDGNYRMDMLFRDSLGNTKMWFLDSTGTLVTEKDPASISNGIAADLKVVAIGDFNGDARADLFLQSESTGTVEVRFMKDIAKYSDSLMINAPADGWELQTATDVDSDYLSNLIWKIPGSNDPFLATMAISGTTVGGAMYYTTTIKTNWSFLKYNHVGSF